MRLSDVQVDVLKDKLYTLSSQTKLLSDKELLKKQLFWIGI